MSSVVFLTWVFIFIVWMLMRNNNNNVLFLFNLKRMLLIRNKEEILLN